MRKKSILSGVICLVLSWSSYPELLKPRVKGPLAWKHPGSIARAYMVMFLTCRQRVLANSEKRQQRHPLASPSSSAADRAEYEKL